MRVRVQGRHRYHELAGPDVAAALEAIARIAPPSTIRTLRRDRAQKAIVEARTCYDHLAGRLGVELRDRLLDVEALCRDGEQDHLLTDYGQQLLLALDLDPAQLLRSRRVLARTCIDWTHRRPHLAGAIPAAITTRLIDLGWLTRSTDAACAPPPTMRSASTPGSRHRPSRDRRLGREHDRVVRGCGVV